MKNKLLLLVLMLLSSCLDKTTTPSEESEVKKSLETLGANGSLDYQIKPVAFTAVEINDNFWAPRLETNRKVTIPYNFQKCEETGRISNFSKAGGLEEGEFEGIFFNDSDVFKVIEGASYSLQVHYDEDLKTYLDDLILNIAAAQEDDGYLYTNRTIDPSKAADKGGEKRWTSLKEHHELYNVGHLYEAAVAHFQTTGERNLLDVAIKNADLIDRDFGPNKNMGVPGHEEIEIGLVKLYRVTGEKRYLDLAKFFIDQRGNNAGHDLGNSEYAGQYQQDHMPLKDQRTAVGHAVRAGYFYSGATDIAALTGETAYDSALDSIWNDVVHKKIYLTGGIGAEPKYEGFGPAYELPNATAYTETCAAIALMLWNHRMFLRSGSVKYMDVFERTLYNCFLAGVSFEGNTFFYPNPLEADGVFKFNQGVCGRSPWFDCSCCPVNVVRILPSLPGYIYAVKDSTVYVNLYIGNETNIPIGDHALVLKQKTNYPWDGKVAITFNNEEAITAAIKLRIPSWNRNTVMDGNLYSYVDGLQPTYKLLINGEESMAKETDGYLTLPTRRWSNKDKMEITFDMPVRKVISNHLVQANIGKIAFERGPLVYCAEAADNKKGVLNLSLSKNADFSFGYDPALMGGLGTINGTAMMNTKGVVFKAIPYYAWAHREMGEMAVWLKAN